MAYVDPNQEENVQSPSTQSPAGGSPNQAPSTSGAVGGASAPGSYSAAAPSSGTAGSGFQNLNSYLDANQGNNLGGQVAGKISGQATTAQNDLTTAQTGFKNQVDANTVNTDSNNINSVLSDPTNASTDATSEFQKQLNANSSNVPTNASSYQPYAQANTEATNAYNAGQAAQSEGGRMSLLNNYFGTPTYNQGEQSLDQSLLSGGDQTQLNGAIAQTQNLPSQFQAAGQALNNYGSTGAATTAATNAAARAALGVDSAGNPVTVTGQLNAYANPVYTGAIGNIQNAVLNSVGAYNNGGASAEQAQVANAVKTGDFSGLTPQELTALNGLNNFSGQIYNVDPTAYLTDNAINATNGTAITPQQQAQLQALYSLAGTQNTFAPNASEAGTSQTPVSYNYDGAGGFQSAVTGARDQLNSQLAKTQITNPQFNTIAGVAPTLGASYAAAASRLPADQALYASGPTTLPNGLSSQGSVNIAADQSIINQYNAMLQNAGAYNTYNGGTAPEKILAPNTKKAVQRAGGIIR